MQFIFLALSLILLRCSYYKYDRNTQIRGTECSKEIECLSELMDLLSRYDIRDMRTRRIIGKFFKTEEDLDMFISSMIYKIREKDAYYGTFNSYRITSFELGENHCNFSVQITLRRRYSLEDIRVNTEITFTMEDNLCLVRPSEYIGEIRERIENSNIGIE